MKTLTHLPAIPTYLDRFVAIRDKKRLVTRASLVAGQLLIAQQYDALEQAVMRGSLATVQSRARGLPLGDNLRSCYDGPTKPLTQLKQAIKDAQPERLLKYCPMCGTTLPGTFDHYMPAVRFPEFAVHPLNLVPCCGACNSTKDDDWLSGEGRRQYLHAYTDSIPDLQFVVATFHLAPDTAIVGATFSLQRPVGIDGELWRLITSHFLRLRLLDRYAEQGNDEIAEIIGACRSYRQEGGPNVRAFLRSQAADRRRVHGRNHWVAVLMGGMSEHPELINWISG